MHARPRSWSLALASLSLALAAAGCGDNLSRRGGGDGGGSDAGPRPDAGVDGEPDAGGEPDGGGASAVVTCPVEIPAASEGACDVQDGAGSAVLVRGTVLGLDTVYENGGVLYDGGEIACVGCDCADAPAAADATRVDCAGAVISPGLINPHDHITFTEGEPIDHGATRYNHRHDWRGTLSAPQNPHGTGATSAGTRWGELRMALSGVTSMVGSGGATGMVRNLDRAADADALGLDAVEFETFSLGDANEQFHADCAWGYAIDELSAAALHAFLPHVAEGINNYAAEEFRCQSTSFDGGQDFTERNDSHIHGIGLDAAGYARMARDRTRLIWSPRSNISLYGHTAQVTAFDRLGGVIALGTDWTYSGSVNMVRELACADEYNRDQLDGYFSDEDLWRMATWNAAVATGSDAELGSIEVGKRADLAVYAAQAGQHHRAVLEAQAADTLLVVIGGRPVFGEADVVAGLGEACEALDVCGQARAVCANREFGVAYDSLAAQVVAGNPAYPAFFCGAPDGDSVADVFDNCPFDANPDQRDADRDDKGDACDVCPEEANPLTVCGPDEVTIGEIQGGTVPAGTRVTVTGAVVTGVWSQGVYVQDPSGGTTNAGVHVFTGSNAGVNVGDIVQATGRVTEYFTDTELDQAVVTRTGTGGVIVPVDLTVAEAATEPYEGMLVRLTDVTDVVNPYNCSADNPACADPNLWLVNNAIVVYDRLYQGTDWVAQAGQSPVVGVMTIRFDRRRIMPRTGADIGPSAVASRAGRGAAAR